jgi:hypothetical protein
MVALVGIGFTPVSTVLASWALRRMVLTSKSSGATGGCTANKRVERIWTLQPVSIATIAVSINIAR